MCLLFMRATTCSLIIVWWHYVGLGTKKIVVAFVLDICTCFLFLLTVVYRCTHHKGDAETYQTLRM